MLHLKKLAAIATAIFLAEAPAHATDIPSADDTARFLAGMAPSAGSPLAPLTTDAAWQRHAKFFDAAFSQLEQRQLSKIRDWGNAYVPAAGPTMFYMFSGPDFLYADAFYPKATTYVLSALEPTGAVPDFTRLPRPAVAAALYNVERSMASILSFSFFITQSMKLDLREGQLSGTLPILYVFLARSGKTIREVTPIALDAKGAPHFGGENAGKNATQGLRIVFTGADRQQKTLYYFSTDLSNSSVRVSGFLKFSETLAPADSLIKSASYLLHSGNFSTARNFLLSHSNVIIQDDSGIPLTFYDPKRWRLFPFGRYARPIDKFPGNYQPEYTELFRRAQPIGFGIGYRWRSYESNLLLSIKAP